MFERNDYLNWDETFMSLAKVIAMRSKDPATQVGAVIVDKDNHILSLGYNGAPIGFEDNLFPWAKTGDELQTKYPYVCHAEMNAISNYDGNKEVLKNAKVYVTLFPCNECAKLIIQNGIKEVIYCCDKHSDSNSVVAAKTMFSKCGVKLRQYSLPVRVVIPGNQESATFIRKLKP